MSYRKFKHKKLKKNQLYFMVFDSGYREYFGIGTDLEILADKLLKRYNSYCTSSDEKESLKDMVEESDYYFNTYIIEMNSVSDTDYLTWGEQGEYLGDYLDTIK